MHFLHRVFREPINSVSHLVGGVLALFGFVILLQQASRPWAITAVSLYGLSMVGLFFSSGIYHWVKASDTVITRLRKLDHMMIYVLIAGSYTPFALLVLEGKTGWIVFGSVWAAALLGIVKKAFWITAPRWLSTGIFLAMGWASVIVLPEIYRINGWEIILFIGLGGLCYSVGAVVYALKKPTLIPNWLGFHEIWHVFVLGGSIFHYLAVYLYVPL